jgi:hypothetical protein
MSRGPLLVFVGLALAAATGAHAPVRAQDSSVCYLRDTTPEQAMERPSPLGVTTLTLDGQEATLCYSRVSARRRKVMGGLVPWGTPWRMGANEATALHIPFPASVGGVQVAPGEYSLYAVPDEETWTVVVNRSARRWGIPVNDEVRRADVGSFELPVERTEEMVEQLTYAWEQDGPASGRIVLAWEHTRLEIPVRLGGR